MKGIDHLVESEGLCWLLSWQETYEHEYDNRVRRLLLRASVVIAILMLLHGSGVIAAGVGYALIMATFLSFHATVNTFFDDFFANGAFSEDNKRLVDFSLVIVLAVAAPGILWW